MSRDDQDLKSPAETTPISIDADGMNPREAQALRDRVTQVRKSLLILHKALLEDDRKAYEAQHGNVANLNQFLNLVMHDAWFDWLHRISEIIVQIDEFLEDSTAEAAEGTVILASIRTLFDAASDPTPFMQRYKAAIRREPLVVHAHIAVQQLLNQPLNPPVTEPLK